MPLPWPASGASFQLCRCHFCHSSMLRIGAKWIKMKQNELYWIPWKKNAKDGGEHKPSARVHSKLRRGKAFVAPKVSAWRKAPTRPQLVDQKFCRKRKLWSSYVTISHHVKILKLQCLWWFFELEFGRRWRQILSSAFFRKSAVQKRCPRLSCWRPWSLIEVGWTGMNAVKTKDIQNIFVWANILNTPSW
jgi:hypothetical protein